MPQHRILMVQENIQSARYTRFLLEEAGYLVDWRPAITPALLRTESLSDAVLFDFHFLNRDELAGYRLMRDHARWRSVPSLVAASIFDRDTRLLLQSLGADEIVAKPFGAQELLIRLQSLFRTASPSSPSAQGEWESSRGPAPIRELAQFAAAHASPDSLEAIMVQLLRLLRRKVAFDVGYVCAEGAPERYSVVAHVGDATCNNARWYEPGMSYTGWIAQNKQALVVPNIDTEARVRMLGRERGGNRNFHSFVGVPIMIEQKVIGTMEVAFYRPSGPDTESLRALEVAGQIASVALSNVQARRELTVQVGRGSAHANEEMEILPLVCQSPAMQEVLRIAARVRDSDVGVLLTGETGTGKGLIARYLHQSSQRRQQPFVVISCGTIPEAFQSAELFGVEQGALVAAGAGDARAGCFERSAEGTLFLDQVEHMPLSLQVKLLRVLDERQFSRIGGTGVLHFTGRVVAATSADLQGAMDAGLFLPELYHRLALILLPIPPLRQRARDIPVLIEYFNERFRLQQKLPVKEFSAHLLQRFEAQPWPGNVRELKNAVERSILLYDGAELALLGAGDAKEDTPLPLSQMLEEAMDKQWSVPDLQLLYSRFVYEQVGRNKAHACRILKINYRTLCNYLVNEDTAATSMAAQANQDREQCQPRLGLAQTRGEVWKAQWT